MLGAVLFDQHHRQVDYGCRLSETEMSAPFTKGHSHPKASKERLHFNSKKGIVNSIIKTEAVLINAMFPADKHRPA
jgi:hypothetical protein